MSLKDYFINNGIDYPDNIIDIISRLSIHNLKKINLQHPEFIDKIFNIIPMYISVEYFEPCTSYMYVGHYTGKIAHHIHISLGYPPKDWKCLTCHNNNKRNVSWRITYKIKNTKTAKKLLIDCEDFSTARIETRSSWKNDIHTLIVESIKINDDILFIDFSKLNIDENLKKIIWEPDESAYYTAYTSHIKNLSTVSFSVRIYTENIKNTENHPIPNKHTFKPIERYKMSYGWYYPQNK